MTKIGIFIPCYNVQNSIRGVLSSFSAEVLDSIHQIITVDNCSQDQTLSILKEIQAKRDAIGQRLVIIKNNQNYGLGGSQKIAYQYFLTNGFTHFFVVHGDGQGDGDKIGKNFLQTFRKHPDVDLIMTSRFIKGSDTAAYSQLRVFGNWIFNVLTFLCTGQWMTDSGAGIIFVRTEILKHVPFPELTNSFQFNPELNVLLCNLKNLKTIEIPLSWSNSKDKSNISSLNYCLTLLKILLRYRWNKTFLRKTGAQLFHNASQRITPSFEILTRILQ